MKTSFFWKKLGRARKGAVSVEFALLISVFLLILGGIIDFSHYLYIRQVVTNASREGARYGCVYATPRITSSQIESFIKGKYDASVSGGVHVTTTGAGGSSGNDLTVTVKGSKTWFFLECLISQLSGSDKLHNPSGVTAMKIE